MRELVLGSGYRKEKSIDTYGLKNYISPIYLDINPECNPDVVWDLNNRPLPFKDEEFDEIHAYEVLEHLGQQGNYKEFFKEFYEYWRILKPGGLFAGSCPRWDGIWAWGDPSHTRVISPATFTFLDRSSYEDGLGSTMQSDFRSLWKGDFRLKKNEERDDGTWIFVLEKYNVPRTNSV